MDAQGVRHRGSDYVGRAPWIVDQIKTVAPQNPYAERKRHHTGSGSFRVTLDLNTGSVVKVTVVKSTGFPALDNSAANSFRRWRWKPGKWKEIELPVTFTRYKVRSAATRLEPDSVSAMNGIHLTSRWSQPLAAVMRTFDFMKQFSMLPKLAAASGGSAPSR